MTEPNADAQDTSSANGKVFAALSADAVSAKSIQVATGLTYKQVTEALHSLAAKGDAASETRGQRTLWSLPSVEPVADASADVEPVADVEPLDDGGEPEPFEGRKKIQEMTKGELLDEANTVHGLNLAKATKKDDLAWAVTDARNAAYRRRLARKAITDTYNAMKAPEVKALAKERGIAGYTAMKKAALVEALADQDQAPTPDTTATAAQSVADGPAAPDGPWGTPDGTTAPTDELSAVLADLQATAPVSAPPAQVVRRPRADGAPAGGIVSSGQARAWGRGELESTLVARMADAPDVEHSPTILTKWWNDARPEGTDLPIAQSGSVAFALDQAVKRGTARLTQASPKRYAAVQPALA